MLDQKDNENKIQQYMEQMNIQLEWTNWHLLKENQSWFIEKFWLWAGKIYL